MDLLHLSQTCRDMPPLVDRSFSRVGDWELFQQPSDCDECSQNRQWTTHPCKALHQPTITFDEKHNASESLSIGRPTRYVNPLVPRIGTRGNIEVKLQETPTSVKFDTLAFHTRSTRQSRIQDDVSQILKAIPFELVIVEGASMDFEFMPLQSPTNRTYYPFNTCMNPDNYLPNMVNPPLTNKLQSSTSQRAKSV